MATDIPDYFDPQNLRYAQKLAAAMRAWQAVTDPNGTSKAGAYDQPAALRITRLLPIFALILNHLCIFISKSLR
ncbi:MAG: hypothetical protein DU480_09605 [Nitrosomonas sp.]